MYAHRGLQSNPGLDSPTQPSALAPTNFILMNKPKLKDRNIQITGIKTGIFLPFTVLWLLKGRASALGIVLASLFCIRQMNIRRVFYIVSLVIAVIITCEYSNSKVASSPFIFYNFQWTTFTTSLLILPLLFNALIRANNLLSDRFTVGEALILCSGFTFGFQESFIGQAGGWLRYFVLNVALIIGSAFLSIRSFKSTFNRLIFLLIFSMISLCSSSCFLLSKSHWINLISLILSNHFLLLWWPSLLIFTFTISASCFRLDHHQAARTKLAINLIRKFYHFVAVGLFLPAYFKAPNLLAIALGFALIMFLLVEAVRVVVTIEANNQSGSQLIAFISKVSEFMKGCQSDLDGGQIILSHIYLLLGCAIPIWLHLLNDRETLSDSKSSLSGLAGIISLGIGDSIASIIGITFGKHRWPRSSKTLEGSLAGFMASFLTWSCISKGNHLGWWAIISAGGCLWESLSRQNDNITLPLLTFILIKLANL